MNHTITSLNRISYHIQKSLQISPTRFLLLIFTTNQLSKHLNKRCLTNNQFSVYRRLGINSSADC